MKGPPCTRQSPLILAAFRPWGGSQVVRRTRGVVTLPDRAQRPPVHASPTRRQDQTAAGRPAYQYRLLILVFANPRWRGPRRSVSFSAEDSPRGLGRTLGKRVGFTPSRVRISYPPPRLPVKRPSGPHRSCRVLIFGVRGLSWRPRPPSHDGFERRGLSRRFNSRTRPADRIGSRWCTYASLSW